MRIADARRRLSCLTIACASLAAFATDVDAAIRLTPEQVNIRAFARQNNRELVLLVRIPLGAVKEVQFPTRSTTGELDVPALQSMLPGAARYFIASAFPVSQNGVALGAPTVAATRLAISSDASFSSVDAALAHMRAPDLAAGESVFWETLWFDIDFRWTLPTDSEAIAIQPVVAPLGVNVSTDLTYITPEGTDRAFTFEGNPGLIRFNPTTAETMRDFVARGVAAIATHADLLVLLLCLALPFRRSQHIVPVLGTFSLSALLAMIASAAGLLPKTMWVSLVVQTLLAAVIVLTAAANVAGKVTARRRALLALGIGALVGLTAAARFSQDAQYAAPHVSIGASAFTFAVLVTAAAALALVVPLLALLFSFARAERLERIIVSALMADTAWWWLAERWTALRKVPLQWSVDSSLLAPTLMLLAGGVLAGGAIWFVNEWLKSFPFADQELSEPLGGADAA